MSVPNVCGPWKYDLAIDGFRAPNEYEAKDFMIVHPDSGECIGIVWEFGLRGEANARLIAAAPDLFQSLRKIVTDVEQAHFESWLYRNSPSGDAESVHGQWKDSHTYQDFADTFKDALDALAKATGETP